MRKVLLLVSVFTIVSTSIWSQIPQPNTHLVNTYINKFQGTWRWVSGNDTVILRLGKIQDFHEIPPGSSSDVLVGCHTYIKGGVLKESSMDRFDSVITIAPRRNTFYGFNLDDMDTMKVEGFFKDISKHKRGNVFLEYIDGPVPQIIWKLENTKGLVATPPSQPFDYSFTLPKSMVLTKQ